MMQHAKITARGRLAAPSYGADPRARYLPTLGWGQPPS